METAYVAPTPLTGRSGNAEKREPEPSRKPICASSGGVGRRELALRCPATGTAPLLGCGGDMAYFTLQRPIYSADCRVQLARCRVPSPLGRRWLSAAAVGVACPVHQARTSQRHAPLSGFGCARDDRPPPVPPVPLHRPHSSRPLWRCLSRVGFWLFCFVRAVGCGGHALGGERSRMRRGFLGTQARVQQVQVRYVMVRHV